MGKLGDVVYHTRNVTIESFSFLSHMPILTAACMLTTGPVLELGAGFGSTLALHGMCGVMGREILTLESSASWLAWFKLYSRKWHKFKLVDTYMGLDVYTKRDWGMVLVDHGILGERGLALADVSHIPVIVAHDTDWEELNYTNEGVPRVLKSFKYRYDHQWIGPQTSIFSNSVDVVEMFRGLGL